MRLRFSFLGTKYLQYVGWIRQWDSDWADPDVVEDGTYTRRGTEAKAIHRTAAWTGPSREVSQSVGWDSFRFQTPWMSDVHA